MDVKGQFYSVIALIIIIPVTFFLSYYLATNAERSGIEVMIVSDQMHQVERSVERDFGKALSTSVKRALIAASDKVVMEGESLKDALSAVKELVINGTVNGEESMLMLNNTLNVWVKKISSVPTNFKVNISFWNFSLRTYDPFHIMAYANLNISVTHPSVFGKIEKNNMPYTTLVSIAGINDPLFTLKTNGSVTRSIKISPHPYRAKKLVTGDLNSSGSCSGTVTFNKTDCSQKILVAKNVSGVTFSCFSGMIIEESTNLSSLSPCYITGNANAVEAISNALNEAGYDELYIDEDTRSAWILPIKDEIENGYYFAGNGPDFFMRLESKTNTSVNGLETFVNLPELESYGIPVNTNRISVDYIYFGNKDYIGYPVRGLPSWFRLNKTFADRYNLTELCEGC